MEQSKMKFRPILFSTPMVQALIEGTKTQTRRTKGLEDLNESKGFNSFEVINDGGITKWLLKPTSHGWCKLKCPNNVGDVFWVRETFHKNEAPQLAGTFYYKALIDPSWGLEWKPSIFMPKQACRIFLKIKTIRVERLNEISSSDAQQEGLPENGEGFVERFKTLWNSINGLESWDKNPFVFVYEFERIEKPLNFI
jgi:hypothetical protein